MAGLGRRRQGGAIGSLLPVARLRVARLPVATYHTWAGRTPLRRRCQTDLLVLFKSNPADRVKESKSNHSESKARRSSLVRLIFPSKETWECGSAFSDLSAFGGEATAAAAYTLGTFRDRPKHDLSVALECFALLCLLACFTRYCVDQSLDSCIVEAVAPACACAPSGIGGLSGQSGLKRNGNTTSQATQNTEISSDNNDVRRYAQIESVSASHHAIANDSPQATTSALPLIQKVTPQDGSSSSASIATHCSLGSMPAVGALTSVPMATDPGYYHLQDHHLKQVRFDQTKTASSLQSAQSTNSLLSHRSLHRPHRAKSAAAARGTIATTHCGVSKRGRYVSPGRRTTASRTVLENVSIASGANTNGAASKENEGKFFMDTTDSRKDASSMGFNATRDLLISPKSTEAKSFLATTPTDFTADFGATPSKSGAFDTSNVLAWLSSPGLFSTGFASPNAKGPNSSKTSTPIVSTSFFFSDVANLPKGGDSNIICISPLAATKMTPGESWKEVFASPSTRITGRCLMSKPSPKGMDAVLAERDVREDEDLSALLQLASNSTPKSVARKRLGTSNPSDPPVLPTMQDSGKMRLFQKIDPRSDSTFQPPSLGMRTNTKRDADQAFPFQPSSDYYGSMRVTIGGGKGPPSPKQQQPYPYQMFAALYQQPDSNNAPYTFPTSECSDQPSVRVPPAPRPKKKSKLIDKGEEEFVPTTSPAIKVSPNATPSTTKRRRSPNKKKNKSPQITGETERLKAATAIQDLNAAAGGKNDKAAALAAAILRGVTQRPSGKWQAQLYFAGKSRYIGVFDSREKAALAYEIAREKLKAGSATAESTEALVNEARKAAFDGVNEQLDCL